MDHENGRVPVRKMYKLYINGAFVRSESGRSDRIVDGTEFGANIARASRKDVRDAVTAARAGHVRWSRATPSNRGLVLYRLGEMLEARRAELIERVREGLGVSYETAEDEVVAAIDRTIWYAGWCDKYNALLSTRNPVSGPHFNFSTAEPMGVVGIAAPDDPPLLGLVSTVLPAIAGGNAVVAVASERDPRTAIAFAEAVATSDLPAGVLNILTGTREELLPVLARHMDVNALGIAEGETPELAEFAATNVKRYYRFGINGREGWFGESAQSLHRIEAFSETKTIWHPAGV